ncbi:glycerate kinase [Secundilactobacillus oryzae JCM 18671]|uniref:Glycerate kinase n=1 Tax=Secundilactobacillus oryzae JCM 18671 TaxID=1291743 RepID=A0A081BHS7_9LACO|nr:glycerate kinase [Secundilactobacillus oryzae]GAK47595.1 glycerate kinase [Secundilactobacillus oryzae JCM 18671]
MKFVLAPDSFKESMTAKEAAAALERGLRKVLPNATYQQVPMADGGEGTVQSLVDATNGQFVEEAVLDPLGQPTSARFGLLGDQTTAVIEMAAASGIQFVSEQTKNPLKTSTFGTGQLIRAAVEKHGATKIIIGIGGSATNDGGAGMAEALGVKLLDTNGKPIQRGGGHLDDLVTIDVSGVPEAIREVEIDIASDVTNPLTGEKGASAVFGPQKGATPEMIKTLDANLHHYAEVIKVQLGKDLEHQPGAGAAGGLGTGLLAFTNSQMRRGVDIVVEMTHLKEALKDADVVITGEGGIDFQTQYGKTPTGVSLAAKEVNPDATVIAVGGRIGDGLDTLYELGIRAIFPIVPGAMSLSEAMNSGQENLERVAESLGRLFKRFE